MKKKYKKAEIQIHYILLDDCLAAGSGRLYPGGPASDTPLVNDWLSDDSDTDANQGFSEEW